MEYKFLFDKEILKGIEVELEVLQNRLADLEPGSEAYEKVHEAYIKELDRYIQICTNKSKALEQENQKCEKASSDNSKMLNDQYNREIEKEKLAFEKKKHNDLVNSDYLKSIFEITKDVMIVVALKCVITQSWRMELGEGEILTNTVGKEATKNMFGSVLKKIF